MHVLIIPSWYPTVERPVAGIFFREQAHALAESGEKIGVIAPQLRSFRRFAFRKMRSTWEYEEDKNIPTYRWQAMAWFPRVPYANNALFLKAGRRLFKWYAEEHGIPDLIHAHSAINGGLLATFLGQKYHIPVVLTEHSTAFIRGILSNWQKKLVSRAFRASHTLISVSPQLGALLGRQYPETAKKWNWVPNMVNCRFFENALSKAIESSAPFRFLNIALMKAKKGQKVLLEAFAKAFKEVDAELCIGGDGPLLHELKTHADRLGIRAKVNFLGLLNRREVPNALYQADVFVLSSHYETFGVVVAEALAAGRPVIATRCGGPECIVEEKDGLLVKPGDVDALAGAMRTMYKNKEKYSPEDLRDRCRARFGEDAVVGGLKTIYSNVLTNGRPNL